MIILALLPVLVFILLWILLLARHTHETDRGFHIQESFLIASLMWSAYLALGTELLSLMRGLTTVGVALLWAVALLVLAGIHWKGHTLIQGWMQLKGSFTLHQLGWFDALALSVILIALLILLITGFMSPPNIHDVLAYHMSRVMHWVQNRSLSFYPTSISWQLWMPPFSEFSQLHWQLLTGGDIFASFHQWYYLVFIMIAVSATAKQFGSPRRGQILSAMFILTVPIVVLQASGAKNDIVLSFFVAALLYYIVKATFFRLSYLDWVASGISVGLGVLTKGTFSFFALPLMIWLLVILLRKLSWKTIFAYAATGLIIIIVLNSWHWARNTRTFGSPLTSEERSSLMNNRFGAKVTLSNLSRHAVVQMNGKYGFINEAAISAVETIHSRLEMDLFDPDITYGPREFYYVPTREEVAGNPFHFASTLVLPLIGLIGLMINPESRSKTLLILVLSATAISGAVLFSAAFRWQTWSTRFFIPYYVLFSPVLGYLIGKLMPPVAAWFLAFVLVLVLVNPLMNNYSRAFSWSEENRNSIWRASRKSLLFANNTNIEGAVLELTHLMEQSGCRTYGLKLRSNAPEYLLWASLTPHPGEYYLEHIFVENITEIHASPDFDPCGIVLFEVTEIDQIDDTKFNVVQRWSLGGDYPFSLFLTPDYATQ